MGQWQSGPSPRSLQEDRLLSTLHLRSPRLQPQGASEDGMADKGIRRTYKGGESTTERSHERSEVTWGMCFARCWSDLQGVSVTDGEGPLLWCWRWGGCEDGGQCRRVIGKLRIQTTIDTDIPPFTHFHALR